VAEINGVCDERFEAVREVLAESLHKDDVGAAAAVYPDGEPVVDLWGAYADAARTIPWGPDTITNVWSTTKTMTALCALVLADRGDLDLAAPVARYWPEFGAAGKQGVQVRHVLAHTAGLPDFDGPLAAADLYDWSAVTARLAAQAPRWEPGTAAGYHSLTQGFIVARSSAVSPAGLRAASLPRRSPDRWALTFTSGWPPSMTTGWRPASRRRPRRPGTGSPPRQRPTGTPAERLSRVPAAGSASAMATAWPGAARRFRPPAASATPARSPPTRACRNRGYQTWRATSATSSSLRSWVSSLIRFPPIETGENPHWVERASRSRPT
jgi:hypothetical protein